MPTDEVIALHDAGGPWLVIVALMAVAMAGLFCLLWRQMTLSKKAELRNMQVLERLAAAVRALKDAVERSARS